MMGKEGKLSTSIPEDKTLYMPASNETPSDLAEKRNAESILRFILTS
jgi:hypothetical protein